MTGQQTEPLGTLPAGVRAKLGRARTLIAELDREISAYHAREPYVIVAEDRPDTGQRVAKVGQIREPIPAGLPLLVGDAVHNLRGVLDPLAYHLSPGEQTYFPIWKSDRIPSSRAVSEAMAATFTLDVALTEPELVAGKPLVPMLGGLADHVEASSTRSRRCCDAPRTLTPTF